MEEAKWLYGKHTPTVEEYMKVALVSSGYTMLSVTSFVGMGDLVTKQMCDWVVSESRIVRASSIICRLMDDMVGYGKESKITAVECYMKQNDASEAEAFADFREQVKKAWKDMNEEWLQTTTAPLRVMMNVVNLARVINLLYVDEDGYTNSKTETKYFINYVLVEPVIV
ncbi:Alpha-humulene/(-)-(E)-beta-caryophyllene synthase [Striga hermonthica]|nr:Alpha-humulene/(-)-(E)-beta-caryophyllene synthase [Striga hermonthica]